MSVDTGVVDSFSSDMDCEADLPLPPFGQTSTNDKETTSYVKQEFDPNQPPATQRFPLCLDYDDPVQSKAEDVEMTFDFFPIFIS